MSEITISPARVRQFSESHIRLHNIKTSNGKYLIRTPDGDMLSHNCVCAPAVPTTTAIADIPDKSLTASVVASKIRYLESTEQLALKSKVTNDYVVVARENKLFVKARGNRNSHILAVLFAKQIKDKWPSAEKLKFPVFKSEVINALTYAGILSFDGQFHCFASEFLKSEKQMTDNALLNELFEIRKFAPRWNADGNPVHDNLFSVIRLESEFDKIRALHYFYADPGLLQKVNPGLVNFAYKYLSR